ncbi:phage tail tape measure protein [Zhihengliuella halotolerans]|uniref:phage tail tape measure protein n=1 Tax=Zhihengliuella halotolerans TaxID=370736 RepID=UPI000C8063B6|nr:phage tail tape measure protein [Zhihengliuella halotolerans]
MADRSVTLKLEAKVNGLVNGLKTGKAAVGKFGSDLDQFQQKHSESLDTVGKSAGKMGLAVGAGLALAGKAAMDWESAWAGVTKTVEASPKQFAEIEEGLRDMTRILPASHDEIAGVAAAAGQLGVKAGDIVGFTKTMVDLGESTNLTAEEAATSIAQISNVMGTMEREGAEGAARFGAALVDLGNNSATTEADILNMAQRIAGAGATVGATEGDVLALSATLASMGVKAELGGGVASRILLKLREGVDEGGESLAAFAETAGLSADEFSQAFREDPVQALGLVSQGIGQVNESGGNVTQTLKDMGITGSENVTTMLALANSGDLLNDSLERSAEAWSANTALVDEAEQRYATTESKIKIAWNTFKDAAIDAGAVILPVISGLADGVADLAGWFGDLPPAAQGVITTMGGIVGAGAGALGLFVKFVPEVRAARSALTDLAPKGSRASRALRGVGKSAGFAAAALAAISIGAAFQKQELQSVEDFEQRLINAGKAAGGVKDAFGDVEWAGGWATAVDGVGEALTRTTQGGFGGFMDKFADFSLGIVGAESELDGIRDSVGAYDSAVAKLAQGGNMEAAAQGFREAATAAAEQGTELADVAEQFPQYLDHLRSVASEAGATVSKTDLLTWAMEGIAPAAIVAAEGSAELNGALEEVGVSADGAVSSIDDFLESLFAAGIIQRDVAAAERELEAAIDGVTESIKTNGKTLDITTEKGRANEASLYAIGDAGRDATTAMAEQGATQEELQGKLSDTYDSLITAAGQFGITGDSADELAREILGIPDGVSVESWMDDHALQTAEATSAAVRALDGMSATVVTNSVRNEITRRWTENPRSGGTSLERGVYGQGRQEHGGRVMRRYSEGGRLPATGLGTDKILGTDAFGNPTAWVDDREWVINRQSSDKYNRELAMINAGTFPKLPGLASGGQAGAPSARDLASPAAQIAPVVHMPSQMTVILGPNGPKVIADVVNDQVREATRGEGSIYHVTGRKFRQL